MALFTDPESQKVFYGDFGSQLHGIAGEQVRLGFIRKVYGLVCAQVTFTAAMALLSVYGPLQQPFLAFVISRPGLFKWGTLIATLAAFFGVSMFKKSYPLNLYLLGFFTFVLSLDISFVCLSLTAVGLGTIIAKAAAITALLSGGLTLYALKSKRDFSFLGAALFPLLFALSIYNILAIFFPSLQMGVMGLIGSAAGALIFCAYILFDTYRIIHVLKPDDYIEAAIQLYLDIVNLFLYIVEILVNLNKEQR
jgi:protein lifeguard